jgi:very-short-patch-repair endonuclease
MEELEKSMYYGATPSTLEKARHLRNKMTTEEIMLWEKLKGKQICNLRFRRQHPINIFIADFYCHEAKMVIELDGKIHLKTKEYDKERTSIIQDFEIEVLRFTNDEVSSDINSVVEKITENVKKRLKNSMFK